MTKPRKYHIDEFGREYREVDGVRYTYLPGKMSKSVKNTLRRHLDNPESVLLPPVDWEVWGDDVSDLETEPEPEPSLPVAPPPQKPRPRLTLHKSRIAFVPRV